MQAVAVGISIAVALYATAAQRPTQRPPADRFRTAVELVEVDVIVTDRRGKPVRGLTRGDFEIREDGVPVEITSFERIELPEPPRVENQPAPPVESGAVMGHNLRALEGGIYLILLDVSVSPGRFDRARKAALALIEQLGPADQAAMMSTGGQKAYQVEFTTDRARLTKALDRLVSGGQTMENLPELIERIARQLEPIPARRKVVALISEGFRFDPDKPEFRLAFDAAHRANLAVYAFDPKFVGSIDEMIDAETVQAAADARDRDRQSVAGLQTLAANTGGRATVRTNFLAEGVRQMIAENRSYYLLRYYSPAAPDGKFHSITVTTRRPDLEVRARPGYTASKPEPSRRTAPEPPPLARIAGAAIQTHGLDMRTIAVPVPSSARTKSAILVVTELRGSDLAGTPGVELAALAVDMSGRVRARDEYTASVAIGPEGGDRWLRIVSRVDVPAGRYQLRVAARRTDGGASGSVFAEVEVPSFSGAIALGGLVLGTPHARGVARADRIEQSIPVVPIATTELPEGMPLAAALPLRIASSRRALRVEILARLTAADGSTRELLKEDRSAAEFSDPAGGAVAIPLPSEPLPPGEYRLRVDLRLGAAAQHRELAFKVAPVSQETRTPFLVYR